MAFELDPLDDIFAEDTAKNAAARVGGKFQPKAKQKPSRKGSAATSVSSLQPVPTTDVIEHESSVILKTNKHSEHCFHRDDQKNSISVTLSSQNIVTIDRANTTAGLVSDSDVFMPDGNCSWQSNFDKSGENGDILLGLESLDDFLPHATADMETIADGSTPSEAASADVPCTKNAGLPIPVISSINASTCPQQSAVQDPLTGGEPIISISYDGDHMDNRVVETEEMDIMDTQVLSDLATSFGRCSRKFQPKPKIQMQNKIHEASTINADGLESASCLQDSQSIPSEINFGDKCSNPAFSQDDILDLSAVGFTHAIPSESMAELIVDEDPIDLMETSQLNPGFIRDHPEFVPKMPAELSHARTRKSKARTPIPSPEQQNASTSGQENEAGRSLRPRKNKRNLFQLVDEFDDEFHVDGEFPAECPSSSVAGEDNISDKKFQVENESQRKKVKRNSVKPISDKEKPAGKQKKPNETLDQAAKLKPKKFSHSTLKRRRVDKVLLETPEDEIDFQKVPLRDLILLAEHKEQLQKKEATTGVPSTNQSNGNPSENYNEDEPFASERDGEYDREQESQRVEESNIYFNYQTYMDRTPRVRWSKQDTELFYEAIQQFGTDLSMIQQLFPGRTRNQVKLKYKKEERQHPMRLREALTNRAKDHSHFEKVIEHLQQIAAEEKQNSNKDDSIDLTGNEDAEEGSHEANEEELKVEREGGENEYTAQEFTEIQSPVKSCDSEDDYYLWSQYKSDI
ncbi:uncharacterized protein LOC111402454 isoform X1 [Olea europaea var. sylvestris]|uniref:uncharacterized protein LOC111402454 isoform X1 n=1 Tax=Olea europaea var. sylvestris TaxID=158386 RepID=UPI000C1D0715|nr:uncharacterized protein LOC111402454 isoform X1 [Olea europaea var. sylvestris]XP_022886534.1 uncharacterized protein LOC111402454 isoform X1 [Olea europaea var. sylvestris]XP_022886535.1 uncharacterized protein LOC111402454 isoform X1 [Olea europaea var. sylvestris]XP_022886536.1 uncharacterized protein LOC111402454 isoform X1 [Olea europaea var. sylvestris]XP_022886537.1 uncharacterized protein LOC111402454 isoform X1 [Olea europaea var. sylvestris]